MDITRDTPDNAETFGLVAYRLGDTVGAGAGRAGLADLAAHVAGGKSQAIVVIEDPVVSIARQLQDGASLDASVARWSKIAEDYLAQCRRGGRRIALCQPAANDAGVEDLHRRLAQRFPEATLPTLLQAGGMPEIFYVSLVRLAAAREGRFHDLLEEIQARCINPSDEATESEESLSSLLTRWRAQHDVFHTQSAELKGQADALQQSLAVLAQDLEAARKGQETQTQTAALLNGQVTELETVLKYLSSEAEKLKAEQKARDEAHQAQSAEQSTQIATLTAERDEARSRMAAVEAERNAQVDALNARLSEQSRQTSDLQREVSAASIRIETLQSLHRTQIDELNAQIADQTQAVGALTEQRDAALTRLAALETAGMVQVEELNARITDQARSIIALSEERDAALARFDALQSADTVQIEELRARISDQTQTVSSLIAERDAVLARIADLQAASQKQLDAMNARISSQTQTVTSLAQERDAVRGQIHEAAQIEAILGQQMTELKQALIVTDTRYRAVEAEKQNLQRAENSQDPNTEKQLQEAQKTLAKVQGEWQRNSGSADAFRQYVRQSDTALGMMEKRRRELQAQTERLQAQLDAVYASTSWRVTGPLRSVRRLFHR